tara:strand:+ start:1085 stop:1402 length:318 start_codon:yes stop_codon:yes gene_type:complete
MKLMLRKQHNEYVKGVKVRLDMTDEDRNGEIEMLVSSILHTKTLNDINDIMIEYGDLIELYGDSVNGFVIRGNCSIDDTLNYVLTLLIERIENDKQIIHSWNLDN